MEVEQLQILMFQNCFNQTWDQTTWCWHTKTGVAADRKYWTQRPSSEYQTLHLVPIQISIYCFLCVNPVTYIQLWNNNLAVLDAGSIWFFAAKWWLWISGQGRTTYSPVPVKNPRLTSSPLVSSSKEAPTIHLCLWHTVVMGPSWTESCTRCHRLRLSPSLCTILLHTRLNTVKTQMRWVMW